MYDAHHFGVILIQVLLKVHHLLVFGEPLRLVKHAEHLVEMIVYLAMEQGNLHYNAVVDKTVDKRVFVAIGHLVAIVVHGFVAHINHRLVDVANTMPQQINGNHRNGVALVGTILEHVLLCIVLCGEVSAETECLSVKPCLLQLNKHEPHGAVVLPHPCGKVDAEHGDVVACDVGMLMPAHLHTHDILLQQCRDDCTGDTLVFQKKLENSVVYGVCYCYLHNASFYLQI